MKRIAKIFFYLILILFGFIIGYGLDGFFAGVARQDSLQRKEVQHKEWVDAVYRQQRVWCAKHQGFKVCRELLV